MRLRENIHVIVGIKEETYNQNKHKKESRDIYVQETCSVKHFPFTIPLTINKNDFTLSLTLK